MNLPLFDYGMASGLVSGILFGYVLEQAGFGSPCKLTAQFRLTDWSVFKVMFTAIIVCAVGLAVLSGIGALNMQSVYVPTVYFWAIVIGGALIGAGFAIGGYCPGTSVVGLFSGRLDALVFMIGMLIGVAGFASVFDTAAIQGILGAGAGPEAQTLPQLLGLPAWLVLVGLVAMAVGGFWLGARFERRGAGPLTAEAIRAGAGAAVDRHEPGATVESPLSPVNPGQAKNEV
ncbi:MAG: DUF6691 family protein [Halothiobacillaceae bacterium]